MIDDPNVVLPLATTYNERGVAGYTHVVTNAEDQRKVNCFYEVSKNPMTGKGTLTLSKRPGVSDSSGGATWGDTTQGVYLIITEPTTNTIGKQVQNAPPWVVNSLVSGGGATLEIRVSSAATDTTVLSGTTLQPFYIDKTIISGVENVVLQLGSTSGFMNQAQRVFYSSTIASWTEISDGDFTSIIHRGKIEHMDGFAFVLGADNKISNSDTNSLQNWTASSFITKQVIQDIPAGLARLNNQIIAFGEDTVEMFYNAGNTVGSPLLPIRYLHQKIGLVKPRTQMGHYYAIIGKRMFFAGSSGGGIRSAGVYTYDGQSIEKISTPYIDKIFSEIANQSLIFQSVNSLVFSEQQAVAFSLSQPGLSPQKWLMFFPELKEWFEWTSTVFCPINSGEHHLSCGANLKNKIYHFDSSDSWQDAGTSYQWLTQFRLPSNGSTKKSMIMYGVDADTDTSPNTISVDVSDNDCQSFYSLQPIDLTWERKVNFRGGTYTRRHVRLSATDARPKRIANFIARVDG